MVGHGARLSESTEQNKTMRPGKPEVTHEQNIIINFPAKLSY